MPDKVKYHIIRKDEIDDLRKFIVNSTIICASSSYEKKKLVVTGDGWLEVRIMNYVQWRGNDLEEAVEVYNSITEEWKIQ